MADWTTTGLLASIRRRAMLPSASATGTADADLLAIANEELKLRVAAELLKVREDYFVSYTDVSISGSTYRVPSRAIGLTLREAAMVTSNAEVEHLRRYPIEDIGRFNGATGARGYYLRGNYVHLIGDGTGFSSIRFWVPLRPSELTSTAADWEAITAINTSTNTVTVGDTSGLTGSVDLVSSTAFDRLSFAVTASSSTGTTLTFSSLPTGLAVGDYVCVADKSPVPNIPAEFHSLLAQVTAIRICVALGDYDGADRLYEEMEKDEAAGRVLTSPRTQGASVKTFSRDNFIGRRRVI